MAHGAWARGAAGVLVAAGLRAAGHADSRDFTIKVGARDSCEVTCSRGNLRDTGGNMTVAWRSNADYVSLSSEGPAGGGRETHHEQAPTGTHTHKFNAVTGAYTMRVACRWFDDTRGEGYREDSGSCVQELSCFVRGTLVLMCDGTEKEIQNIGPGERVKSWNPATLSHQCSTVQQRVETHAGARYQILTSAGGRMLEITPTHQLLVDGQWRDSSEVREGSELLYADGRAVRVTSVRRIDERIEVFNLITDFPNDFFANNILVHNDNGGDDHRNKGFVGKTLIMKADGTHAAISTLKSGDKIMAWDPKTGRFMHNTVRRAFSQRVGRTLLVNGRLRMATRHVVFQVGKPKR